MSSSSGLSSTVLEWAGRVVSVSRAIRFLTIALTKAMPISSRLYPQFKAMHEAAAKPENRAQANIIEQLFMEFCRTHDIKAPSPSAAISE